MNCYTNARKIGNPTMGGGEGDRWLKLHNMQNRIGIVPGQMVTGNMGSESRMNYTMMGDNANTEVRLESSAKQYGIYIQIADSTYQPVKDKVTFVI